MVYLSLSVSGSEVFKIFNVLYVTDTVYPQQSNLKKVLFGDQV